MKFIKIDSYDAGLAGCRAVFNLNLFKGILMKKLLSLVAVLAVAGVLSACNGGSADYSNVNEPDYAYGASTDTGATRVEENFNSSQRK